MSLSHHSPDDRETWLVITRGKTVCHLCVYFLTKNYWDLFVVVWIGVGKSNVFGVDNECSIHCSSKPSAMSMPPQSSFLVLDGESVRVARPRLDRALSHVLWPVSPRRSHLTNAMPGEGQKCISYLD